MSASFRIGITMGKALRPEHTYFFTKAMERHDLVSICAPIPDEHEFLFKIIRTLAESESEVIVHLTDAYCYSLAEFYARPDRIQAGSFVVIGIPHANAEQEVIEIAKQHRIGIGKIGKFMGALNFENIWEYMTPEERKEKEEEQRRKKQRRKTN